MLTDFSKWVKTQGTSIPKHDLAPLITAKIMYFKEPDNSYSTIAGLAYLRTACLVGSSQSYSTSVNQDQGVFWSGLFTLVHELGHK